MAFVPRHESTWQLRTRSLQLGRQTAVMGILNVTPDSFSDGGQFRSVDEAVEAALRMFAQGAAIVDIGGESTRPGGYETIPAQQELDRVLPVIEGILCAQPQALLSIDTYRASTARVAVEAGVEILNDVSGFLWDPAMGDTCAALRCGVVLMHTRGRPSQWQSLPALEAGEVVPLVLHELRERLVYARTSGIASERIVVDPGFGFGKRMDENWPLLAHLDVLLGPGYPIVAGVSRKGFLGRERPAGERDSATMVASAAAILNGASIIRVHNVTLGVEAARVADAIRGHA